MSLEVLVLVVGAVFILLSLVNSIAMKIKVPMILIGVSLVVYGGFSYGAINQQGLIENVSVGNRLVIDYPVNKIHLTSPTDMDSVKCRIITAGVYPEGNMNPIWVVLKASNNRYYPQSDHTNNTYKSDGEWQVITRFGGDVGESYELIVYETDITTSEYFTKIIANWKEDKEYPGLRLRDIPSGAEEVDRIQVILKGNCRGVF